MEDTDGDVFGDHKSNYSYNDNNYYYDYSVGSPYMPPDYMQADSYFYYEFFEFERPVYLYTWELLVILTTLANILVMLVLARRSMRNATNAILIAIAVSDSLTGLVTLPTYFYAYQHYERKHLKLTEGWCEAFMISKLFISKAFHTISVWLTVCLGLQRYISVSWPFRAQSMFTIPKTLIMIAIVAFLSPMLHIYHLTNRKAIGIKCAWMIQKNPCKGDCAYLWMSFLFMHFIPCLLLVILTTLMLYALWHTEARVHETHMISNQTNLKRRAAQSRRISIIVVIVVIVFLIPEIPYGIFLLISVSLKHQGKELMQLHTNRAFHCAYELLLVLSFHANFWVYVIMNRKFRSGLLRTFDPCLLLIFRLLRIFGIGKTFTRRPSVSSTYGGSHEPDAITRTMSKSNSSHSILKMKTYRVDSTKRQTDGPLKESPSNKQGLILPKPASLEE